MQIILASGTTWHIREAGKKLAYRTQLPGIGDRTFAPAVTYTSGHKMYSVARATRRARTARATRATAA